MCVVSMIADHYRDKFTPYPYPGWPSFPNDTPVIDNITIGTSTFEPMVTKKEFDELKRKVDEMVELLKRAKEYDKKNNEPDCEVEDKMDLLRRVAKAVGVDLDKAIKS